MRDICVLDITKKMLNSHLFGLQSANNTRDMLKALYGLVVLYLIQRNVSLRGNAYLLGTNVNHNKDYQLSKNNESTKIPGCSQYLRIDSLICKSFGEILGPELYQPMTFSDALTFLYIPHIASWYWKSTNHTSFNLLSSSKGTWDEKGRFSNIHCTSITIRHINFAVLICSQQNPNYSLTKLSKR